MINSIQMGTFSNIIDKNCQTLIACLLAMFWQGSEAQLMVASWGSCHLSCPHDGAPAFASQWRDDQSASCNAKWLRIIFISFPGFCTWLGYNLHWGETEWHTLVLISSTNTLHFHINGGRMESELNSTDVRKRWLYCPRSHPHPRSNLPPPGSLAASQLLLSGGAAAGESGGGVWPGRYLWFCLKSILGVPGSIHWSSCVGGFKPRPPPPGWAWKHFGVGG